MSLKFRILLIGLILSGSLSWPATSLFSQEHTILAVNEVLEDLGLTDEQREKAIQLHAKYQRIATMTALDLSGGIRYSALSTKQQEALRPKFGMAMQKVDAQATEEMQGFLSSEQMVRLKQLRVQALGPAGIIAGKLESQLGMTLEQIDPLTEFAQEFQKTFSETRLKELGDIPLVELNAIYRAELTEQLILQLTPEQQATYRELVGVPAELPPKIEGLR